MYVWLLRYILHDWGDSDAARILAALRAAMGTTKVTLCIVIPGNGLVEQADMLAAMHPLTTLPPVFMQSRDVCRALHWPICFTFTGINPLRYSFGAAGACSIGCLRAIHNPGRL